MHEIHVCPVGVGGHICSYFVCLLYLGKSQQHLQSKDEILTKIMIIWLASMKLFTIFSHFKNNIESHYITHRNSVPTSPLVNNYIQYDHFEYIPKRNNFSIESKAQEGNRSISSQSVNMNIWLIAIFGTLVASVVHGQDVDGFSTFRKANIPSGFKPTSSVAGIVLNETEVNLFYRGQDYSLVQIKMEVDGTVTNSHTIGGTLLSSPSVAKLSETELDVSYVSIGQKVVVRSLRAGVWGPERAVGIRSEFAPAIIAIDNQTVTIFVTKLNQRVVERTRTGTIWGALTNSGFSAMDGPAAMYLDHSAETYVFARRISNRPFFRTDSSSWTIVNMPRLTSSMCAASAPEGAVFTFARNARGLLEAQWNDAFFEGEWSDRAVTAPWMSGRPACFSGYPFCTGVAFNQNSDVYFTFYCS